MPHLLPAIFGVRSHLTLEQECARAALIFVYGLILIRLSGRRSFGRWSALDIIVSVTVGSSLSRALTGNAPLWGTLAATAVLMFAHWLAAFLVARNRWLSHWLEGLPVILAKGGRLDERLRLRHSVSSADIAEALHRQGLETVDETKRITLEPNGQLTVAKS